ncbi:hypothetical protein BH12200 [Bartonella henselae str. Houston-1]|uniref:Uncharacterized protein n=1 Tax=Bartonella henselae (strain ATCC 49882 / DSM 28221 / CCUG 30454 / Houston 1) TaxID=283166 RepID=A0A0H3LY27_BARHE|nr:hypothetical protein BH12200 [Bartonella henselae str. Houston-1]
MLELYHRKKLFNLLKAPLKKKPFFFIYNTKQTYRDKTPMRNIDFSKLHLSEDVRANEKVHNKRNLFMSNKIIHYLPPKRHD